jgi:hypothetical protein
MANADNPRGLWPVGHLTGGRIGTREFTVTTGATIYRGDIVEMVAGGTVDPAAATDGVKVIGVAANYVNDSASAGGKKIAVYCDPFIIFGIQSVTGVAIAVGDVGESADPDTYAAGSTSTFVSSTELAASSAQTALFHIIGLINSADNAWGEHADVMVIFNEHRYKASAGAAGI